MRLLLLIVEIILLGGVIYCAVRKQRTTGILKKISLQGNEFEIGKENDESLFDKYLNEVLYLFENTDADVIVFEDLDRHESSDIFTRLREVNTLVNQHRPNKILRFFYLIRDDIFSTKDRAKFFDFIIPIVPVIDGSNAYDKFIEFFRAGRIKKFFSDRFLQGLSLYIDEMRVMKNIINEFHVYYNRLNTTGLDGDKMLALITYKNLFPRDFSELQLNRGFVYELFESKQKIIAEQKGKIEAKITAYQKLLTQADNAFLTSAEIDSIANFECQDYYRGRMTPFISIKQKLAESKTFYEAKIKVEKEQIAEKIIELKKQIALLETSRLSDLLSRDSIDLIFYENQHIDGNKRSTIFEEIKGSSYFDLLKFLLRNGYIDESYSDYMTYFYPESITKNDKSFLRSIADRKAKDWSYPLDDSGKIAGRLFLSDFAQPEILNFQLLNYLIQAGEKQCFFTRALLQQLRESGNIAFVNGYLLQENLGDIVPRFINELNVSWPGFFRIAVADAEFHPNNRVLWAQMTLCVSSDNIIKAVDQDGCLRDFIGNTPEFLGVESKDAAMLIQGMILLNVEMMRINPENSNQELLKVVYEKDRYALNAGNIVTMLVAFYGINDADTLWPQNYSLIIGRPISPLAKRIGDHINEYLDIVFQQCNETISDDQKYALMVLNAKDVSKERKEKYIKFLSTTLSDLKKVKDTELWSCLLQHQNVICRPENILEYFSAKENKIDNVLIGFINDSEDEGLDFSDTSLFADEEEQRLFFKNIVQCSGVDNNKYEKILKSINLEYQEFTFAEIETEKARILIKIGKIKMSIESLSNIREHYSSLCLEFIHANFVEFLELMPGNFDEKESYLVLNSSEFADDLKINLLDKISLNFSVQKLNCSDAVLSHVISRYFDKEDFDYLIENYDRFLSVIQVQIIDTLARFYNRLSDEECALPSSLLKGLIQKDALSHEIKIRLFANSLDLIADVATCQNCLRTLNLTELEKLFNNGRPKITNNELNIRILTGFREKGWIRDYAEDSDDSKFLKITKQRLPIESSA